MRPSEQVRGLWARQQPVLHIDGPRRQDFGEVEELCAQLGECGRQTCWSVFEPGQEMGSRTVDEHETKATFLGPERFLQLSSHCWCIVLEGLI